MKRLPTLQEGARLDASLTIVNVVLLLIFFFLATGALMNSPDYKIVLPQTKEVPLSLLPKPILIVGPDGSMTLNGDDIQEGMLSDSIIDEPVLHILADRGDPAHLILQVLAREKLVAVEVRLVTVHLREGAKP